MRVLLRFMPVPLILALSLVLGLANVVSPWAAELAPIPALTGRVVDQTSTLSEGEIASLTQQLQDLETEKGSQVAVLMVATTAPEDIAAYSIRVAEAWKLGRKQVDDGALLIIAKDDRTLRIEVGYGLEGALTDLVSRRIIDDHITPRFKQGDYFGGVQAGIAAIASIIRGEDLPPPARAARSRNGGESQGGGLWNGLGALLAAAFFLPAVLGPLKSALLAGAITFALVFFQSAGIFWSALLSIAAFFLVLIVGSVVALGHKMSGGSAFGRSSRGRSGMGWGGGGFGGRSGGFGGLGGGGGGFGGGGASGRW